MTDTNKCNTRDVLDENGNRIYLYDCKICDKSYVNALDLNRHERNDHLGFMKLDNSLSKGYKAEILIDQLDKKIEYLLDCAALWNKPSGYDIVKEVANTSEEM